MNNSSKQSVSDQQPAYLHDPYGATLRKKSDCGRVFPTGVRIGKTPYGLGVFSYAFIPSGTPIGRVRGIVIHDDQYSSDYCITAGDGIALEPAPPFCYMNHSCEPNCGLMHYIAEDEQDGTEVVGALDQPVCGVSTADLYADDEDDNGSLDPSSDDEDEECFFGDGAARDISNDENAQENDADHHVVDFNESEDWDNSEDEESDPIEHLYNDDENGVEIWVETSRDIMPGEELTIDYSWPGDKAMKCLCGAKNCRGWIVDPAELEEVKKQFAQPCKAVKK